MSKQKKLKIICIALAVIIATMFSASNNLSLRLAVFLESPKSAFTMKYEKIELDESNENAAFFYIKKNPPIGSAGNGMYTWVVYSYGPFHYAKYYGEA